MRLLDVTTTGIQFGKPIADILAEGFTACYDVPYSTATTSSQLDACNLNPTDILFVGSRNGAADTLSLGAYGAAGDVFTATNSLTQAVEHSGSGVFWYFVT
eukprot:gene28612-35497_t